MTVAELITLLSEAPQNAVVQLAHQPGWPMEFDLAPFVAFDADTDDDVEAVYLATGEQVGYLDDFVVESLRAQGWARP